MSTSTRHEIPPSERVKSLERKAQAIRSRLLRAVDELDARRNQVVAAGTYAKQMARPAAISALGAFVTIGLGVMAIRYVVRSRRENSLRTRIQRAIQRLELVPQPSLASRIFEKATLSLVTLVAGEVLKRMSSLPTTRVRRFERGVSS